MIKLKPYSASILAFGGFLLLVMGSYIFTTGLLTIYIAFTSFHTRTRGAYGLVALSGISSIGTMTVVNFMIGSDFKWILLIFTLPWVIAMILCGIEK